MAEIYAFLAEGLEEVECLAAMDVLVRGGEKVTLVSINGERKVTGAHGFQITADKTLNEVKAEDADVYFLPGGMPGTKNLAACGKLGEILLNADKAGKHIAAICAAPSVLGQLGILKGRTATCYPGFEDKLSGAVHTSAGVVTDGNITTGRGLGYALDLGLELLRILEDSETALKVKASIQYDQHE